MCLSIAPKPAIANASVSIEQNNDGNYINIENDSSLKAVYNNVTI